MYLWLKFLSSICEIFFIFIFKVLLFMFLGTMLSVKSFFFLSSSFYVPRDNVRGLSSIISVCYRVWLGHFIAIILCINEEKKKFTYVFCFYFFDIHFFILSKTFSLIKIFPISITVKLIYNQALSEIESLINGLIFFSTLLLHKIKE